MADDSQLSQNEIEELLRQAQGQKPAAAGSGAAGPLPQAQVEQLLDKAGAALPPSKSPAGDNAALGQAEIEALLKQQGAGAPRPTSRPAAPAATPTETAPGVAARDVEYLLSQAERALASIDAPAGQGLPAGATFHQWEDFRGEPPSSEAATLELVRDVDLDLKIELGRTLMHLEEILKLRRGSVVTLDKLAGDPVDIYVNGRLIARGEVLVLNDNFCVRVAELVAGESPVG